MSFIESHNLVTLSTSLVNEWHPTKNILLSPLDVTSGSGKKVWWKCKKGHAWEARIDHRSKGVGCPYCSGRRADAITNLAVINPSLAKEWHPTKNDKVTPVDVKPGSDIKAWWKCKKGHEWKAKIYHRNNGIGCPFCSKRRACPDNCLEKVNTKLAKEWHLNKNKYLTPRDVTPKSHRLVWWQCKKGHEWKATVKNRAVGTNCPYCSGQLVCDDNCLKTVNPLIAKQWHPTKNKKLSPKDVTSGSDIKVWWLCQRGHEWKATVANRTHKRDCPYCHSQTSSIELRVYTEIKHIFKDTKHRVKIAGYECDIYIPSVKFAIEVDGAYWHKNKYLSDNQKSVHFRNNGIILLRLRENGLEKISECDLVFSEQQITISLIKEVLNVLSQKSNIISRDIHERIKRYMKRTIFANEKEYADLLYMLPDPLPGYSLADTHKNIAKQWHPTKNGSLTPENVSRGSHKKIWWVCKNGHEWQTLVSNRVKGKGCPYCAGRYLTKEKSLRAVNPKLTKEWHPFKNNGLTPENVMANSGKKAWWRCSKGHEWFAVIGSRNKGIGCPFCWKARKAKIKRTTHVRV